MEIKHGVARLLLLCCCMIFNSYFHAQSSYGNKDKLIDSLTLLLNDDTVHDTLKITAEIDLEENKWNMRLTYWDSLAARATAIGFKIGAARAFNNMGVIHYSNGDIPLALTFYDKSLALFKEINNKEGMAKSHNNLGYIHLNQGNIASSLDNYQNSLKLYEALGDKDGMAQALNNIGLVYDNQEDSELAMDYWKRSMALRKEIGDKKGIAYSYNNIAGGYYNQGDTLKALDYYQKSLRIQEEINNKKGIAESYNNLGLINYHLGELDKGLNYYQKSLAISEEIGDKFGIAYYCSSIGQLKFEIGELAEAKSYAKRGLALAKELGFPSPISRNARVLSKVAEKENSFDEALAMFKLHISMRDSIANEENQKAAVMQQAKYEYEKQQAIRDAEHEAQLEVHAVEKEKQKAITLTVSFTLALVVLFSFFLYKRFRITKKQKAIIEEKNTEILDSITYAKRLQDAILPPTKLVNSYLVESFILYKPKDIVAGDFYFMDVVEENGKKLVYYVAADCTGHGVPGAMVSIVGANGLKRCIQEFNLRTPGEILDKLAQLVAENFSQSEEKIRDGMDLALCCLEMENDKATKVHYAGANNPLWVINSNRKITPSSAREFKEGGGFEIKANKQAIGYTENIAPFTTHTFEVEAGDTLYTFSDGYPDQFGGENGKKYKSANFRRFLLSIQDEDMEKQKQRIDDEFENWKGELEQIDDVCVIGVRL